MKKTLALLFALTGWFAVVTQYVLMLQNNETSLAETTIRFFSFFTILSNILVAGYFTSQVLQKKENRPGFLTAVTLYITVVGLVYNIVLRSIWTPTGIQKLVDELLHSVIPVVTIIYWAMYEKKSAVQWKQIPGWLVYPAVYFIYIIVRGNFSGFYPYPFVNVTELGIARVFMNAGILVLVFAGLAALFTGVGKLFGKK